MFPWFRRRDQLDHRADQLAATLSSHFGDQWKVVTATIPSVAVCNRDDWRRAATIAGAMLSVFPLLKASGGDPARFIRLRGRVLGGLEAHYPRSGILAKDAESATIPPSGHERSQTLHEVDETTSLALAGWVVRHLGGSEAVGQSWDDVKRVSEVLRRAVSGYWDTPES